MDLEKYPKDNFGNLNIVKYGKMLIFNLLETIIYIFQK